MNRHPGDDPLLFELTDHGVEHLIHLYRPSDAISRSKAGFCQMSGSRHHQPHQGRFDFDAQRIKEQGEHGA